MPENAQNDPYHIPFQIPLNVLIASNGYFLLYSVYHLLRLSPLGLNDRFCVISVPFSSY